MPIVPRQPLADDEVVEFWKKKAKLSEDEIAALVSGVNPFAWEHYPERAKLPTESRQAVEDVLTVLRHRVTDPLGHSSCTRKEWERVFARCDLSFPERMKDPSPERIAKNVSAIEEFLADPNGAKKLLEEREARRGKPILLHHWFRRDSWTAKEAMLLLCGLDPNGTVVGASESIFGNELEIFKATYTLDGFEYGPKSIDEMESSEYAEVAEYESAWKEMTSIWSSGDHQPRNPPAYYLEWAARKNLRVPWIEWARENNLIDTQRPVEEKPPSLATQANRSDKLMTMLQAANRFWAKADRDRPDTHPKNATVSEWLVTQGFSPTLANKAATILRPDWAPTGRKPEV